MNNLIVLSFSRSFYELCLSRFPSHNLIFVNDKANIFSSISSMSPEMVILDEVWFHNPEHFSINSASLTDIISNTSTKFIVHTCSRIPLDCLLDRELFYLQYNNVVAIE